MTDHAIQITAHRGGAGFAPENTLGGFLRTLERGIAQWMDFDIQRTADGVPVVVHDLRLTRTSNVDEVFPDRRDDAVGDFTLAELRQLDIGSWFRPGDYRGETMLTFDEALDVLLGRIGISFELKHPHRYPGIEEQVGEVLRARGLAASPDIKIGSFERESLIRMRRALPEIHLSGAFRRAHEVHESGLNDIIDAVSFAPHYSRAGLDAAAELGRPVGVGGNSVARMRNSIRDGIRHLSSDYPDVLARVSAGAEPFPQPRTVTIEAVTTSETGVRTVLLRNSGGEPVEVRGWYLWNGAGADTDVAVSRLQPGETTEIPLSPNRGRDVSSIQTIALHDAHNRLRDLHEYWAVEPPAEFVDAELC